MARTSYTVVAVLREEALCSPQETCFRVTVRSGAPGSPTGVVLMAQPIERPVPLMAGAVLSIDPRLVETTP